MKKLFQKPIIKNILAPLFRSTIKTFIPPLGTAIEVIKNLITPKGEKAPHNWTSIAIQIICWGIIIYAFGTKMITIDDALNYIQTGAPADTLK